MDTSRFAETGHTSFFGDYLYEQIVPREHFLHQLKLIVDWDRFTRLLIKLYKGQGVYGRPVVATSLIHQVWNELRTVNTVSPANS